MLTPYDSAMLWDSIEGSLRKLSSSTRRTYKADFVRFLKWGGYDYYSADGAAWIKSLDSSDIDNYHEHLKTLPGISTRRDLKAGDIMKVEPLAPATIGRYLASISKIFGKLQRLGIIERNPVDFSDLNVEAPGRRMKRPTEYLSMNEIKSMLEVEIGYGCMARARDRAMISILGGGGLRLKEACSLTIGDYQVIGQDNQGQEIKALRIKASKGKPDDFAPLAPWAVPWLDAYLSERRIAGGCLDPDDPLLTAYGSGNRFFTPNGAWRRFKEYCRAIGRPNAHPHSARKSAITEFYEQTKDIALTAEYARHTSIETTRRYIYKNKSQVMAALRRY